MSGRDLEAHIHALLVRHPNIRNITALSRAAGVNRNTFYQWFARDVMPDQETLSRVATALGVTYIELWEAYEGRPASDLRAGLANWQDGYDVGYRRGFAAGLAAAGGGGSEPEPH